jgi:hypothetical protein
MKKILMLIVIALFSSAALALPPGVVYSQMNVGNPMCPFVFGHSCPTTQMWNRTGKKLLARYSPAGANYCNGATMTVWIMGHPKDGVSGFTNNDWQDLEIAKANTGGYYRWGCCWSTDPNNKVCLE